MDTPTSLPPHKPLMELEHDKLEVLLAIEVMGWRYDKRTQRLEAPPGFLLWEHSIDLNSSHEAPLYLAKDRSALEPLDVHVRQGFTWLLETGPRTFRITNTDAGGHRLPGWPEQAPVIDERDPTFRMAVGRALIHAVRFAPLHDRPPGERLVDAHAPLGHHRHADDGVRRFESQLKPGPALAEEDVAFSALLEVFLLSFTFRSWLTAFLRAQGFCSEHLAGRARERPENNVPVDAVPAWWLARAHGLDDFVSPEPDDEVLLLSLHVPDDDDEDELIDDEPDDEPEPTPPELDRQQLALVREVTRLLRRLVDRTRALCEEHDHRHMPDAPEGIGACGCPVPDTRGLAWDYMVAKPRNAVPPSDNPLQAYPLLMPIDELSLHDLSRAVAVECKGWRPKPGSSSADIVPPMYAPIPDRLRAVQRMDFAADPAGFLDMLARLSSRGLHAHVIIGPRGSSFSNVDSREKLLAGWPHDAPAVRADGRTPASVLCRALLKLTRSPVAGPLGLAWGEGHRLASPRYQHAQGMQVLQDARRSLAEAESEGPRARAARTHTTVELLQRGLDHAVTAFLRARGWCTEHLLGQAVVRTELNGGPSVPGQWRLAVEQGLGSVVPLQKSDDDLLHAVFCYPRPGLTVGRIREGLELLRRLLNGLQALCERQADINALQYRPDGGLVPPARGRVGGCGCPLPDLSQQAWYYQRLPPDGVGER